MAASLRLLRRWVEAVNSCKVKPGDPIDALTAWLLASRSCSLTMTFTSSMIGGLLALEAGYFNLIVFGLTLVALLFAHAANNMLNDFYDYRYGLDTLDYFRAQYAPHPILSNLMSVDALKLGGVLATTLAGAIALYLTAIRGPLILLFALLGFLLSFFYVARPLELKRKGLGEVSVFVVWGPLMIGGTYYALTGEVTARAIAASLPYGLLVTTVLIGKHIDKLGQDAERGVSTLPVLLGLERSLALIKLLMISFYPLTALLVMLRMLQPWALLTLLSVPRLRTVLGILSKPKPKEPPEGYRAWPAWYVAFALWLNRRAGGLLILGLALGLVVPIKL